MGVFLGSLGRGWGWGRVWQDGAGWFRAGGRSGAGDGWVWYGMVQCEAGQSSVGQGGGLYIWKEVRACLRDSTHARTHALI